MPTYRKVMDNLIAKGYEAQQFYSSPYYRHQTPNRPNSFPKKSKCKVPLRPVTADGCSAATLSPTSAQHLKNLDRIAAKHLLVNQRAKNRINSLVHRTRISKKTRPKIASIGNVCHSSIRSKSIKRSSSHSGPAVNTPVRRECRSKSRSAQGYFRERTRRRQSKSTQRQHVGGTNQGRQSAVVNNLTLTARDNQIRPGLEYKKPAIKSQRSFKTEKKFKLGQSAGGKLGKSRKSGSLKVVERASSETNFSECSDMGDVSADTYLLRMRQLISAAESLAMEESNSQEKQVIQSCSSDQSKKCTEIRKQQSSPIKNNIFVVKSPHQHTLCSRINANDEQFSVSSELTSHRDKSVTFLETDPVFQEAMAAEVPQDVSSVNLASNQLQVQDSLAIVPEYTTSKNSNSIGALNFVSGENTQKLKNIKSLLLSNDNPDTHNHLNGNYGACNHPNGNDGLCNHPNDTDGLHSHPNVNPGTNTHSNDRVPTNCILNSKQILERADLVGASSNQKNQMKSKSANIKNIPNSLKSRDHFTAQKSTTCGWNQTSPVVGSDWPRKLSKDLPSIRAADVQISYPSRINKSVQCVFRGIQDKQSTLNNSRGIEYGVSIPKNQAIPARQSMPHSQPVPDLSKQSKELPTDFSNTVMPHSNRISTNMALNLDSTEQNSSTIILPASPGVKSVDHRHHSNIVSTLCNKPMSDDHESVLNGDSFKPLSPNFPMTLDSVISIKATSHDTVTDDGQKDASSSETDCVEKSSYPLATEHLTATSSSDPTNSVESLLNPASSILLMSALGSRAMSVPGSTAMSASGSRAIYSVTDIDHTTPSSSMLTCIEKCEYPKGNSKVPQVTTSKTSFVERSLRAVTKVDHTVVPSSSVVTYRETPVYAATKIHPTTSTISVNNPLASEDEQITSKPETVLPTSTTSEIYEYRLCYFPTYMAKEVGEVRIHFAQISSCFLLQSAILFHIDTLTNLNGGDESIRPHELVQKVRKDNMRTERIQTTGCCSECSSDEYSKNSDSASCTELLDSSKNTVRKDNSVFVDCEGRQIGQSLLPKCEDKTYRPVEITSTYLFSPTDKQRKMLAGIYSTSKCVSLLAASSRGGSMRMHTTYLPVKGDAVKGDAVKGDTVKGDTVKGDTVEETLTENIDEVD